MEPIVVRGRLRRRFDDVLRFALPFSYVAFWLLGRPIGIGVGVALVAGLIAQYALHYASNIVVGADGLRVDTTSLLSGASRPFVSYHQIARVDPAGADVRITLVDGTSKTLVTVGRKDSARVLDALRGHVERATDERGALQASIDALEGTKARWAARLRGDTGAAYREGGASEELLARVLSSAAASPLARVGAAVRLRELGADMDLVRDLAAMHVHPKVHGVLEALGAGDAESAARVLDTWDDPSATPSSEAHPARVTEGPSDEAEILEPNRVLQRGVWAMRVWPLVLAAGAVTNLMPLLVVGAALAMTAGLARALLNDKNPMSRKRRAKVRVTPEGLAVEGHDTLDPKRHRVFLRFEAGAAPVLHFETRDGWHVLEVRGQTEEITRGWMSALGADAGQSAVAFKTLVPNKAFQMVAQMGGMMLTGIAAWLALRVGIPMAPVFFVGFALMLQAATWKRTIDVRPDGVELRTFGKPRFISWGEVAAVERGLKGGVIVLADGEKVQLRAVPDDVPATHEQRNDFLVERAHDALFAYRARVDARVRVGAEDDEATDDVEHGVLEVKAEVAGVEAPVEADAVPDEAENKPPRRAV